MSVTVIHFNDQFVLAGGDGVITDPEYGTVSGYASKLHLMPEYDALFAVTGFGGLANAMDFVMPRSIKDFDGLADNLSDLVFRGTESLRESGLLWYTEKANVVLAGFSKRDDAYRAVRVTTYEKGSVDYLTNEPITLAPWEVHPMQPNATYISSSFSQETSQRFGLHPEVQHSKLNDLVTRYICAARAESGSLQDEMYEDFTYNVGGFAQLAVLANRSTNSYIAHEWPEDVVGEPIDPKRGQPLPDHLMEGFEW